MTIDELSAVVDSLTIEVQRVKDMIQTLSESHDQNRRELQFATKTATDLSDQLSNGVENIRAMKDEINAMKGGPH